MLRPPFRFPALDQVRTCPHVGIVVIIERRLGMIGDPERGGSPTAEAAELEQREAYVVQGGGGDQARYGPGRTMNSKRARLTATMMAMATAVCQLTSSRRGIGFTP